MKLISWVVWLVWLCLMPPPLEATTYYVKTAANGGSDAAAGTSWATAWATTAKVNATISAGDVVYFDATGKWYGSQLTPPTGGTSGTQTYYKSMTTGDVYTPFGATICAGDSLGGGWSIYGTPSDSIYQRSYSGLVLEPNGTEMASAIRQQISYGVDSILFEVGSVGAITAAGHSHYDATGNVIYVKLYQIGGSQHPDAFGLITMTAPSLYFTSSTQQYINAEGINFDCGGAGNIWFGWTSHGRHVTVRDGWVRHGVNLYGSSNGALISSRTASGDAAGGDPYDQPDMGMYNSVVACSLDYCYDDDPGQGYGHIMSVYSEWYLKLDSNYMGTHTGNTAPHFKGLTVHPPDASISNPGYQCSNNHIITGDRVGGTAIQMHATTNWTMIYGNVIEPALSGSRSIWLYCDDDHVARPNNHWGSPILIYNNTIYNLGTDGITLGETLADSISEGANQIDIRIKYNIFYNIDNNQQAIAVKSGIYYGITECDSNIFFDSTATLTFRGSDGQDPIGYNASYATWNAAYGFDAHSTFANPEFNNAAGGDFSRPSASGEMNLDYGGIHWSVWGAKQPAAEEQGGGLLYPILK